MHIAILTFQGFNELDSLIALGVLNRIKKPDWRVTLSCPEHFVTSMNGVTVQAQSTLADARAADAVIVGSGIQTRDVVNDATLMEQLNLDPTRQLIGAQCSGTLVLAKLGLLDNIPASRTSRPNPGSSRRASKSSISHSSHKATSQRQVAALLRSIWPRGSSRAWKARKPHGAHCTTWRRWGEGGVRFSRVD